MDTIQTQQFQRLLHGEQAHRVSLFMPTHRSGPDGRQDALQLKALILQAHDRLAARGLDTGDINDLLSPARHLPDDDALWRHRADALAIYLSPGSSMVFRLGVPMSARCVVGPRYQITPLLPVWTDDASFAVLALSIREVRLFRGSRDGLTAMTTADLPEGFDAIDRFIDRQRQLQFHTGAGASVGGARAAVFHGQGVGSRETENKYLLEYCRLIDKAVCKALGAEPLPLLLACDEPLGAIYRQANAYPHLHPHPLAGNPDRLSPAQLHARAWPVIHDRLHRQHDLLAQKFRDAADGLREARRIDHVLAAAHEGQVDTLFIDADRLCWGQYDHAQRQVTLSDDPASTGEDLVNLAAVWTLRAHGRVLPMRPDAMHTSSPAAALLRYAVPHAT